MDLIRKHLMIEGHIKKDCLVRIITEVTEIYSKCNFLENKLTLTLDFAPIRERIQHAPRPRASHYHWRHPWPVL